MHTLILKTHFQVGTHSIPRATPSTGKQDLVDVTNSIRLESGGLDGGHIPFFVFEGKMPGYSDLPSHSLPNGSPANHMHHIHTIRIHQTIRDAKWDVCSNAFSPIEN